MSNKKEKLDPQYEAQFETVKAPKVKKPGLFDKLAKKMKIPKWAVYLIFVGAIAVIAAAIVLPIKLIPKKDAVDTREIRVTTVEGFAEAFVAQDGKALKINVGNPPAGDDEEEPPMLELCLDGADLTAGVAKETVLLIKAKLSATIEITINVYGTVYIDDAAALTNVSFVGKDGGKVVYRGGPDII